MGTPMDGQKRRRWPWVVGGLLAAIVLAVVVGLQILDGWLLKQARQQADAYGQKLGRPIEIGGISTRIFTGSGVKVEDVKLGPAEGEELPMASVGRIEVRAALWPILESKGKDIQVEAVEIHAPEFNVVRLADGSTNLDHLQRKLDELPSEEAKPEEKATETDLSAVRLSLFALTDGKVKFVDRSGAAAKEVAINDLDITIKDLRAGSPLQISLAAAVLAEQQNFQLSLTTPPLPPSLTPTPERITIKAQPIDLAPLVPFLPASAGFLGGTFDADLEAKLGRAVPGGVGPTEVKGVLHALKLKFKGAQGGKALDVTVQTDLSADVIDGSLDLRQLQIDAGPAKLTGKGKIANLASEKPTVQALEIVGRGLDPAALAEYYPPLNDRVGGQIAGPIGLAITGSGTAEAPAIAYDLDFTQARVRVPGELTKAAGAPMRVSGRLRGSKKGVYGFDANVELKGADLRPGELVNKAPGERMDLAATGTLQPAAKPGEATRISVSTLKLNLLDSTMTGTASAELGKTTGFEVALRSPKVDADRIMLSDEQLEALRPPGAPPPGPPPVKDPDRFDGLRGTVALEVDALRMEEMDLQNVSLKMKMVDDEITLEQMRARAYGGAITADGTKIALGPVKRPFEAKLAVKGFQIGDFLARKDPKKKALSGSFDGNVDLKGVGYQLENLGQTLAGLVQGSINDGALLGTDVVAGVSEPLARALPFAARALKGEGLTRLGDELPFGLEIANGVAKLKQPIRLDRPQAALAFDGGIQLTGELNLAGTVSLKPETIKAITGGRAVPREPIPVALTITGPAWKPKLGGIDVKPAVAVIGKQVAAGVAEKVIGDKLGEKGKAVTEAISGNTEALEQEAAKMRAEAEARAAEERAKAEARMREEAEAAKKRAEEEAKRRLRGLFGGGG